VVLRPISEESLSDVSDEDPAIMPFLRKKTESDDDSQKSKDEEIDKTKMEVQ